MPHIRSISLDAETWEQAIERLLLLMAPLAPHITEELWDRIGHSESIHDQTLPEWDPELAAEDEITLVVQVNGRLRDRYTRSRVHGRGT